MSYSLSKYDSIKRYNSRRKACKKGNVRDVLYMVVVLFFIGIFCFVGYFTYYRVSGLMINSSAINVSARAVEVLEVSQEKSSMWDYFSLAVFIGFSLSIIITGWFIGGNPLFMLIYFLVIAGGVVVTMVLSNVWESLSTASVFGITGVDLPITNWLLSNLPVVLVVVGFLGMVAMFGKPYMSGGGGGADY